MSEKRWKIKKEHPWIVLLPDNALLGEGNQYVACGGGGTEGSAEIARLIVKDHNDVVYLRTKRKELEAKNKALLEAFEAFIDQYGCDCGHPFCRACRDTKEAFKAIQGDEPKLANFDGEIVRGYLDETSTTGEPV